MKAGNVESNAYLFLEHQKQVNGARFTPDGKRVLTWTDKSATVWDTRTGQKIIEPLNSKGIKTAAILAPGNRILTVSNKLVRTRFISRRLLGKFEEVGCESLPIDSSSESDESADIETDDLCYPPRNDPG